MGGVRVLRASGRQSIRNKLSGRFLFNCSLCIFFFLQNAIDGIYQRL